MSLVRKDFDSLVDHYIELGLVPDDIDSDSLKREFKAELSDLLEPLYGLQLQDIKFAQFFDAVATLAIRHNLRIPSELLLIDKTLLMLENLCRQLDPEIDVNRIGGYDGCQHGRLVRPRLDQPIEDIR